MRAIANLTVLFDEDCGLCVRVAARLKVEPSFFPLRVRPMRAAVRTQKYEPLVNLVKSGHFVVVADNGDVYLDTRARIMILYALRRYRAFSFRLASPAWSWALDVAFDCISNNRMFISRMFDRNATERLKKNLCDEGACTTRDPR